MLFTNLSTTLAILASIASPFVSARTDIAGVPGDIRPSSPSSYCKQFANAAPAQGAQFPKGQSCSSEIQGLIPGNDNMVSSLITVPEDGSKIDPAKDFTVTVLVIGLDSGFALDPDTQFLLAPQTLNPETGFIQGLVSLVIQQLGGTSAPDPRTFSFFQSFTEESSNGVFNFDVKAGTINSTGEFRICTMVSAASFQPVVMPVAQRGAQDDCIRVTI
ncbi:hypothetical protein BASA50_005105 [Batrachochytrium salamandrivorans]|uniref:Ubiquitin 3 binding protein But2 C-terminal domain-containing protein n=1 Tax=Batrachochytrium salamandrivorans TaxID=1357716 RepID=A0ABQ8FDI7_9FUNG|nr:hypothetical protein BASA62_006940 [Batrachochytrium salamandrivorans]KAH6584787.1 hypothetical protein BASA60_000806 [Batrachochytrium salamandrivorans]KAH6588600.1 hypothetical protein BASA61_005873 [Batrachochytrium salamandrivorans]KAH6596399.1 hypothetical protein BASA50_005105 [Batrachochytrium salamandrivorans]KAH9275618.1 hypothetical protein BASA83_001905 [Batrachochytrium salamandrivorans]